MKSRRPGASYTRVGTVAWFSRLWYLRRKYCPVFADSPARKTRSALDFLVNQSRRALKRYNVILAVSARGRCRDATSARERKRKTSGEESLDCIYRASINQFTRDCANTANTRRAWRDDWQTLGSWATRRRVWVWCVHTAAKDSNDTK